MTRFYIGYVLVGMLIAKDKVELEQLLYMYTRLVLGALVWMGGNKVPNDCLRNRKKKGDNNKKNMETNLDGRRPQTAYIDIKVFIYIYNSVPPSEKAIHAQV